MSKYLSWQEVNEPYTEKLPSGKIIEGVTRRKPLCSDDRVEKVWFHGGCSAIPSSIEKTNYLLAEYIEAISIDGQRFSKMLEDGQMTSLDIPEFDEWIESLNKNNQ